MIATEVAVRVSQESLLDALSRVMVACKPSKDFMLTQIRLTFSGERITFDATNHILWSHTVLAAEITGEAPIKGFCVSGQAFYDTVKSFKKSTGIGLAFDEAGGTLTVLSGKSKLCLDVTFDDIVTLEGTYETREFQSEVDRENLISAINYVKCFTNPASDIPSHRIVHERFGTMIAGSDMQIGMCVRDDNIGNFCCAPDSLNALVAFLRAVKSDSVTIDETQSLYFISDADSYLGFRKVESKFPSVEGSLLDVTKNPIGFSAQLNRENFAQSVKRLMIGMGEDTTLNVKYFENALLIEYVNRRASVSREQVDLVDADREFKDFSLSAKSLLNTLEALQGDMVQFSTAENFLKISEQADFAEFIAILAYRR